MIKLIEKYLGMFLDYFYTATIWDKLLIVFMLIFVLTWIYEFIMIPFRVRDIERHGRVIIDQLNYNNNTMYSLYNLTLEDLEKEIENGRKEKSVSDEK